MIGAIELVLKGTVVDAAFEIKVEVADSKTWDVENKLICSVVVKVESCSVIFWIVLDLKLSVTFICWVVFIGSLKC